MLDFVKLLGDKYKDDLTADEKLALLSELNLANLGTGDYVAKGKLTAKEQEIENLKQAIAAYQEKENANLTDAQKKDLEYQTLVKDKDTLSKRVAEYEFKDKLMQSGFSTEECNKIIEAKNKGESEAQVYADIMKVRVENAEKSAKAEATKKTTPPPPEGSETPNDDDVDDNVKLVREIANSNVDSPKSIDAIKGAYSMGQEN